jgi:iron(II)-dependent oxidoreductase
VRVFNEETLLPPHHPVNHVNWFEAEAWCRWANRRLPSEVEWEAAAAYGPAVKLESDMPKRRYPWGASIDGCPANLDGRHIGVVDVAAYPGGDSGFGCRQMIGNVWEWTSSDFLPFPGFSVDPYEDYSAPWFGTRKVLRGGAWATRSRMISNTYRNFFTPDRRDTICGFRTCAI